MIYYKSIIILPSKSSLNISYQINCHFKYKTSCTFPEFSPFSRRKLKKSALKKHKGKRNNYDYLIMTKWQ